MVLMTPEEFHELRYRERFVAAVERGLADVEAGRSILEICGGVQSTL